VVVGGEKITDTAALLRDQIGEGEEGELVEIDEVFVLVAAHYGDDPEEESATGELFYRCTSARTHVQMGLLTHAFEAVREVEQ
jgi:hypothetical protein